MGIWGVKPLENDDALDLKLKWDELVVPKMSVIKDDEVISIFIDQWGHPIDYTDSSINLEIIALCYLMNNSDLGYSEKTKRIFENAISCELKRDALNEWKNKKERKDELISLLSSFKGKKRQVRISDDQFWKRLNLNLAKYQEYILTVFNGTPMQNFPQYFTCLNSLFNYPIGSIPKNPDEALRIQCMVLTAYVGTESTWKREDINNYLDLISKARPIAISERFPELSETIVTSTLDEENKSYLKEPRVYKSCAEAMKYLLKLVDCYGVGPVSYIQEHYPRFLDLHYGFRNIGYMEEDLWRSTENEKKNHFLALLYVAIVCKWTEPDLKNAVSMTWEQLRNANN